MGKHKKVPKLRFPGFDGEWEEKTLGEVSEFSKGKGISKADVVSNGKTPCIRYGELYTTYKEVISNVVSKTNIDPSDLILSNANDVIIPSSGESPIDIATASCVLNPGIALGGDLNIIRTKLNGVFLSYYLNNAKKGEIASLAQGATVVHLYSSKLAYLELLLPTLPEQTKIADFLSNVDEKLQALKQKKAALETYKKGLMQKLFSQALRFKDADGKDFPDWEVKRLGEVFREHKEQSISNHEFVAMTSSNRGLMLQSDYYGENRITEKNTEGFNVIPKGCITYRSRSDNGRFTFNVNDLGIDGVISVYYPVFDCINGDNYFLATYLNHNWKEISIFSVGTSQRVLSFGTLSTIHFPLPSLAEQTKVAEFLSRIDEKIAVTALALEKLEVWKKGLLQKMFV